MPPVRLRAYSYCLSGNTDVKSHLIVSACYDGGTNSNCSVTSCSSCVSDSVCFHTGECKCIEEFDGMTCDKGITRRGRGSSGQKTLKMTENDRQFLSIILFREMNVKI